MRGRRPERDDLSGNTNSEAHLISTLKPPTSYPTDPFLTRATACCSCSVASLTNPVCLTPHPTKLYPKAIPTNSPTHSPTTTQPLQPTRHYSNPLAQPQPPLRCDTVARASTPPATQLTRENGQYTPQWAPATTRHRHTGPTTRYHRPLRGNRVPLVACPGRSTVLIVALNKSKRKKTSPYNIRNVR